MAALHGFAGISVRRAAIYRGRHTCAEVWRRCGAPAKPSAATRKGYAVSVRRQSERSGACGEAVTLRVGRMAGSLSPGSAKNAAPGCARRLFFRLRPALAPLCAYPPRFSLSRSPVCDARLPSGSGYKQPVCELAWFVPVAPVHPGCSRRLRASLSAISTKVFRKLLKRAKRTGIIERQCM